ncbi:MAG TPA: S9 family peptidase [Vicinamibacterales bacterium]|nr:S9 family peptidase [Vicinamibacterales bacterium]
MRGYGRVGLFLTLGILLAAAAVAQPRPLTFVDAMSLPGLQDPQLSPDGSQVLFVMDKPDWKANRRIGHVYRIGVDGTGQAQLTFGERGESSPRWSPDGGAVAFLARREPDTQNQVYLLHLSGGEARKLTDHPTAPESIAWSPDGSCLYFLASDAPSPEARKKARLQDDVYAFEETNFTQRHLWSVDRKGKTTRLTDGDYSIVQYAVSRDGSRFVVSRAPSPLLEFSHLAEIWTLDADGANLRQLTSQNRVSEGSLDVSPDNTQVLFRAGASEDMEGYHNGKVFVLPMAGGRPRLVTPPEADFDVSSAEWSRDGRAIYFVANLGVHDEIFRLDPASRTARALTEGEHSLAQWRYAERSDRFVFVRQSPDYPGEVHVADVSGALTRVTRVFADLPSRFQIARQERLTWKGADGQTVEGLLYYPVGYRAGERYPLIVATHGGPASSDQFAFGHDAQVYAGKGYAVLKPNYRGSTGYGDAFLREMSKGYFKQAHLDVLAGTDAVIAKGVADADKLVKMGWSAGGHMTNKIITFTDRFKAASSGAGAANWISMYAQSDNREFRTPWFGGTPWEADAPIDVYWNHSPLKDVARVKTPTLFLVGEEDPRVPMPQSVEMYRALRSNGVPTHLYVAPREGHGWTELSHRLFKLQIEMEWFEKWVHGRTYQWETRPGDTPEDAQKPTAQVQLNR